MKLYVRFLTFFYVFFKIQRNMTFYVFLSCCTRFLEHWSQSVSSIYPALCCGLGCALENNRPLEKLLYFITTARLAREPLGYGIIMAHSWLAVMSSLLAAVVWHLRYPNNYYGTYLRLLRTISEHSFIWRPKRLATFSNLWAL